MSLRSMWDQTRGESSHPHEAPEEAATAAVPTGATADAANGPSTDDQLLDEEALAHEVVGLLTQVIDPEIGVNIVDLGLVYRVEVDEGTVGIDMTLTTPGCPLSAYMEDSVGRALEGVPGVEAVNLQIVWEPAWNTSMMSIRAKQELGWPV